MPAFLAALFDCCVTNRKINRKNEAHTLSMTLPQAGVKQLVKRLCFGTADPSQRYYGRPDDEM